MTPYAPARRRNASPETDAQICLFDFLRSQHARHGVLRFPFAVPNGLALKKATAGKARAQGVKAGVWDIYCPPLASHIADGCAGLWIEMKATTKPTENQKAFRGAHSDIYCWAVCYSWIEAARSIVDFYGIQDANIDCALGDRKK